MVGLWVLRTTYMDDLIVAFQRMRFPQAVTIPLVVMFRYVPTLRIEYRQIRSTMDIRGISDTLWKRLSHPLATIEYILIMKLAGLLDHVFTVFCWGMSTRSKFEQIQIFC